MRRPLTIAAAQPPCAAQDVSAGARAHAALVRAAGARVVLFPELSITGYELDAPAVASDDPRLQPLIDACAETGTLALAGAPVAGDGGREHIALLAVDRSGVSVAYRKLYLGGAEPQRFAPGERPAVIEVEGWRLGLAICRDAGVPEHAAVTAALRMDAYLAAVLEREDAASLLDERARRVALAHRAWVVVASFAGSTGGGFDRAAGRSAIWSPGGLEVARAGQETGAFIHGTLV